MPLTRFPARASGPAERLAGFLAHLRLAGLPVGPGETGAALAALAEIEATDIGEVRLALRALLVADAEGWRRFDDLFDAWWLNAGRMREGTAPAPRRDRRPPPAIWRDAAQAPGRSDGTGRTQEAEDAAQSGDAPAEEGEGRLLATRTAVPGTRDLRAIMDPETLRAAERAAERIARAIRDRRSRRRRQARRGAAVDLRRVLRASLARGGEPLELPRRRRPERPLRIVALCDVSGSMTVHARVFLAFLRGLVDADTRADAYVFHTRLVRVTPALRDRDGLRAAARLSLMAEGFGGGTDIAASVESFCAAHAARAVGRRTVVLILSDGYCSAPPARLAAALARLGRRARRIVWLNPLRGWREHGGAARHIAAALPFLDAHLPAATLEDLAALEPRLARL